jgi:hypothetical protein
MFMIPFEITTKEYTLMSRQISIDNSMMVLHGIYFLEDSRLKHSGMTPNYYKCSLKLTALPRRTQLFPAGVL